MSKTIPVPPISCAFVLDIDMLVVEMFHNILTDYCKRFKTEITDEYDRIVFCGIDTGTSKEWKGLTTMADNGTIHVQIQDPWLMHYDCNPFTVQMAVTILAHEMVHVCQYLTDNKGFKSKITYDKMDEDEAYFFDPQEMQAYMLENLYTVKYGKALKEYGENF